MKLRTSDRGQNYFPFLRLGQPSCSTEQLLNCFCAQIGSLGGGRRTVILVPISFLSQPRRSSSLMHAGGDPENELRGL